MTRLKDVLQEQLEEEYQQNEDLRRENKDLTDELIDLKEKQCKNIVENEEFKLRIEKLNNIRDWLSSLNEQILKTSVNSMKGKAMLQELSESLTKGKYILYHSPNFRNRHYREQYQE